MKIRLPAAVVLACASGLSSHAHAASYAVAYDNVYDLFIVSAPFVPITDFTSFTTIATGAANLNGTGSSASRTGGIGGILPGGGPSDVDIVSGTGSIFPGAAPINNAMTAIGQGAGAFYSYSDSQISETALLQVNPAVDPVTFTGNLTQAWGIAEAFIDDADGTADSISGNSSDAGINTTVTLTQPTSFSISFFADPYLFAEVNNDFVIGGAIAALSVSFTISDSSGQVFSWTPDGVNEGASGVVGSIGGTETNDPFSLNTNVPAANRGDQVLYDPCGNGPPTGNIAGGCTNGPNFFSVSTNLLPVGTYTISLNMTENVVVNSLQVDPPPPIDVPTLGGFGLWLLAILLPLAAFRHRRLG